MNAFFLSAPGQSEFGQIDRPLLGPEDVLLRVHTLGLCGTDLNTFRGQNPLVSYPRIPGHEIAAVVADAGDHVPSRFRAGMAVTVLPYEPCGRCAACRQKRPNCCRDNRTMGVQRDGAFTEYISVPWQTLYGDSSLSLRELALVEPLSVSFHAVERGRVKAGDTVAVLGCGAIGLGAIAGAADRGATVIGVDIAPEKFPIAKRCGATHTVLSSGDVAAQLRELTDGEGPDVVIEAIGIAATFRLAVDAAAPAGRVVYIGWNKQPVEYDTKPFIHRELDIMGSRNALAADFERVMAYLEKDRFPVDEVVTKTVPFSQTGEAIASWSAQPAQVTKIHVTLDS